MKKIMREKIVRELSSETKTVKLIYEILYCDVAGIQQFRTSIDVSSEDGESLIHRGSRVETPYQNFDASWIMDSEKHQKTNHVTMVYRLKDPQEDVYIAPTEEELAATDFEINGEPFSDPEVLNK